MTCEHKKHSDYNGYDYCNHPNINMNAYCPPIGCGAGIFLNPDFCEGAKEKMIIEARLRLHIDPDQLNLDDFADSGEVRQ